MASLWRYVRRGALGLAIPVAGCSSADEALSSRVCNPGEALACVCPDGSRSTQHCALTGTALEPCACGGGGLPGGLPATMGGAPLPASGGASNDGLPTGGVATGGVANGGVANGGAPPAGGAPNAGGTAGGDPIDNPGGAGGGVDPVVDPPPDPPPPPPPGSGPILPTPSGACPPFVSSMATFTVGGVPRQAQLYVDEGAAATLDGPVVFYWYGTGGQPSQATSGLGNDGIARITGAGGIVVAPTHVNTGVFPWIGGGDVDYLLMDEVVGCAEQTIGIDETHIHSLGFSAGGLYTSQLSWARSNYLASVATYSGGGAGASVDPSNLFPAMILFGGAGDQLVANFQQTSIQYYDALVAGGHFALLCDHGGGHSIPSGARWSVVQFFFDHGYKQPSPYVNGLPPGFVPYCR